MLEDELRGVEGHWCGYLFWRFGGKESCRIFASVQLRGKTHATKRTFAKIDELDFTEMMVTLGAIFSWFHEVFWYAWFKWCPITPHDLTYLRRA
jgi:hypothetical protein